jgi:acyl-CoA thioesterase
MSFSLDAATELTPLAEGLYHRPPADDYYNVMSMFGGWVLAVAVEAVSHHPKQRGELISISANFAEGVQLKDVYVQASLLRARARTDFWRVEVRSGQSADAAVLCSVEMVWGSRKESEMDYAVSFPEVSSPEALEILDTKGFPKWFDRYAMRPLQGKPMMPNETPKSLSWVCERDQRPLDAKGLAALSDVFPPRSLLLGPEPKGGSTVTYSLYVFATTEDLAKVSGRPLLLQGDGSIVRSGVFDQRGLLWSPEGQLLAVTNQMGFYR